MFGFGKKRNNDIEVIEAYELIVENESNPEFIILDVRTPEEYGEYRIENARNMNYNSNNFKDELLKLEKNGSYLVYCRSGRRSSNAVKEMDKLGFRDVKNISGGILKWNKKGLPLKG